MELLSQVYFISLIIQLIHSVEELTTGFHKKWYIFKMPFWIFLAFEGIFSSFWIIVLLLPTFAYKPFLQEFFLILMFANGIQHLVWAANVKKYVPGLITAPLHIIVFTIFYFRSLI